MVSLSLAMIVKNEEATLQRILECAKAFCDELVVVDTGSTDRTVSIAEEMGAKVFHFQWINDFAAARNHSFDCCTGDWIIWLDADDFVPPAEQAKILQVKENVLSDQMDAVFMTYQYRFSDSGECLFSFHRERLLRRQAGLQWEFPVHECFSVPPGRSLHRGDINIQHLPLPEMREKKVGRNLKILEEVFTQGDRHPRNLFYYANELRDNHHYERAIEIYLLYLEVAEVDWEKYAAAISLVRCHSWLKNEEEALKWCRRAMIMDSSRAEAFNLMGLIFYRREEWRRAIPFFKAASVLPKPPFGFVNDSDYTWMPYDYLSVCYDRLVELKTSIEHTRKALPGNPDKPRLIKNLHALVDGYYP